MDPCKKYLKWLFVFSILLIINVIIHFIGTKDVRILSFEKVLQEIHDLDGDSFNYLILGDSRSQKIDTSIFSRILNIQEETVFNASVNAGCWFGSYSLLKQFKQVKGNPSHILLCVSDYWLERPNPEESLGIYPYCSDYFDLNIKNGFTSFIPIANKRSRISQKIHLFFQYQIAKLTNNEKSSLLKKDHTWEKDTNNLALCNVDIWFSPITHKELDNNITRARKTLHRIKKLNSNITLLYLPNAAARNIYVDSQYPGRRERFQNNIKRLADQLEIRYIDLTNEMVINEFYEDYHHWNDIGCAKGTAILAKLIQSKK